MQLRFSGLELLSELLKPIFLILPLNNSCSISNVSPEIRAKRSFVGKAILESGQSSSSVSSSQNGMPEFPTVDYTLLIDCCRNFASDSRSNSYQEVWLVCNQLGGYSASAIAADPNNSLLRLVPWGGLAACLSDSIDDITAGAIRLNNIYLCPIIT